MYSSRKRSKYHKPHSSKHYAPSLSYRRYNLAYHQQRGLTMDISPSTAKQTPIHMPTYNSVQAEIQRIYESGILDKMYPDFPGGLMPIQYIVTKFDDFAFDPNRIGHVYLNSRTFNQWMRDPEHLQAFGFPSPPSGWHWVADVVQITYTPIDNTLRKFNLNIILPGDLENTGIYYKRTLIQRYNDLTGAANPDSDNILPLMNFTTNMNTISMFQYINYSTSSWTISKNTLSGIMHPFGDLFYTDPGYVPYMTNRPEFMNISTSMVLQLELEPQSQTIADLPIADIFTYDIVGYLYPD